MQKRIVAILWRKVNQATLTTLMGGYKGQYHITLHKKDYTEFFEGLGRENPTDLGGFDISVPVAPFDGPDPVPAQSLKVRYMGSNSKRADWNIPAQNRDSAYPLWQYQRAFQSQNDIGSRDYILIIRDTETLFHCRWLSSEAFDNLPDRVKAVLSKSEAGWSYL